MPTPEQITQRVLLGVMLVAVLRFLWRLEWSEKQEVPWTDEQIEAGRRSKDEGGCLSPEYVKSVERARIGYRLDALRRLGDFKGRTKR